MQGEGLLVGMATVAVVVAGFAAIAPGVSPDASGWTAGHRLRLRAIVSTSFNVTFESLLPVVLFPALGSERASLVLASAIVFGYLLIVVLIRARQMLRTSVFRSRPAQIMFVAGPAATALFGLNALVFASLTAYGLALMIQLSVAALSFYSLLAGGD
ncbi:MAG TPA: hypothetical protein VL687_00870 [Methylomirabilota bacterium]|nr:hypothetical protein [Methylomirabilota bacterium]